MSTPSREDRLQDLLAGLALTATFNKLSVATGEIFHSRGLHSSGKFFAFVRRGELVVKLPGRRVAELVADQSGKPFDAGRRRVMKEWIVLCPTTDEHLRTLVIEAGVFVASLAKANDQEHI